jgi:hypothetical protein
MTQRQTVLQMLKEGPQQTGDFLRNHIPRFSARIQELRDEGYEITSTYLRSGAYRYELTNGTWCWVADLTKPPGQRISRECIDLTQWGRPVAHEERMAA